MAWSRRLPSQSWKTFLRNHAEGIASINFVVVPTAAFKLLLGLVIVCHERHRLNHVAVTANPTVNWIARQPPEAFPWDAALTHLVRDRHRTSGAMFKRRVSAMGIRDRPAVPRSPWQNAYVERLIGPLRRECMDHVIVFGEAHLRRALASNADYYNYNGTRTHLSLNNDAPHRRPGQWQG